MNDPTTSVHSSGISIAALVFGIAAILTALIPLVGLAFGITALILGIIGVRRKTGKGKAVAGIVMGGVGTTISILIVPLLIFLALPALQRGQRDTSHKNDVSLLVSAISSYKANNQGRLPSQDEVMSSEFAADYSNGLEATVSSTDTGEEGVLLYTPGLNCSGASSATDFSVSTVLANSKTYCLDNN